MTDRRGALGLLVVGVLGVVGLTGYLVLKATSGTLAPALFFDVLAVIFLMAGLGRWFRGKALGSPISRREEQLTRSGFGGQLRRLVAFSFDLFIVGGITVFLYVLVHDFMPYGAHDYGWSSYGADGGYRPRVGVDMLRAAWPHLHSRDLWDEIGPSFVVIVVGILYLVPAAIWGATPGMRVFGRVWQRPSDGKRVGALHGLVRALGTAAFAPLQTGLVLVSILGTGQRYRQVGTGRVYYGRWAFLKVCTARRSVADLVCRTELAPRFRPDDGRG